MLLALAFAGCTPKSESASTSADGGTDGGQQLKQAATKPSAQFAFITNVGSEFWTYAEAGVKAAEKELPGVSVQFIVPSEGATAEQRRILDDLLARGVDGISIAPISPDNQTDILNQVAAETVLICHDSDAPASERRYYVGSDNVAAGRQAGEMVKEALPEGGEIMIFVGKMDALNAQQRAEGVRLALEGTNIKIIDIRTDDADRVRAKANAADTLVRYPEIDAMVGLWSYNPPAILGAVREAGKIGQVKIIGFDEEADTLAGIEAGEIFGTVVQQPYEFGYQAVKLLAAIHSGETTPAGKEVFIPTLVIKKDDVADFRRKLLELRGH